MLSSVLSAAQWESEGLNLVFQLGMSRSPLSLLFMLTGLLRAGNLGKDLKEEDARGQRRAVCGAEEQSEKLGEFWEEKTANEAKSRKYAWDCTENPYIYTCGVNIQQQHPLSNKSASEKLFLHFTYHTQATQNYGTRTHLTHPGD